MLENEGRNEMPETEEIVETGIEETAEEFLETPITPEEEPAKYWGGKFESPQELERDWHRQNQKIRELETQSEQVMQPENNYVSTQSQRQGEDPYKSMFGEEFSFEYQEALREGYEAREAEQIAQSRAMRIVNRQKRTDQQLSYISYMNSPERKKEEEVFNSIPGLSRVVQSGDPRKVASYMYNYIQNRPQAEPRRTQSKKVPMQRGIATKTMQAPRKYEYLTNDEVEYFKKSGMSEAGLAAANETGRYAKKGGSL